MSQKTLYGAVASFDSGISVIVGEDPIKVLTSLCEVLHGGQDGYCWGRVPSNFRKKARGILDRLEKEDAMQVEDAYNEVAELVTPVPVTHPPSLMQVCF